MAENVKIDIHNRNIETRLKHLETWTISNEDKKDLKKFIADLEVGKVNKGKRIGHARQEKYLDLLKPALEYFKKPVIKVTKKDTESFERDLIKDVVKPKNKKKYSHWTKSGIRRALKIYLNWRLGSAKSLELTDFFDCSPPKNTPDYLTESQIDVLYKNCREPHERFLIAVLFDAGCRAEEFHNIRYEDIQLPTEKEAYLKIALKAEYSKTLGRTISLYWKNSLEAVREYLKLRELEGITSKDPVFDKSYNSGKLFLHRLGKRALNRKLSYHLFRHTSATFLATKLNRQELCYRYGWRFSSDMPDVYISRAGMESKELDNKFEATELEDLKKKLEKETQNNLIFKEQMRNEFKKMSEGYENLLQLNEKLTEPQRQKVSELKLLINDWREKGKTNREIQEDLIKAQTYLKRRSPMNL